MKMITNLIFILLFGCQSPSSNNINVLQKPNINLSTVSYIELLKGNNKILITDSLRILNIIQNINNSEVEYIKFGSSQKIVIYDKRNKIITNGFFRDKLIKIDGIVYKLKYEIE